MPAVDQAMLRDPERAAAAGRAYGPTPAVPVTLDALAALAARSTGAAAGLVTFVDAAHEPVAGGFGLSAPWIVGDRSPLVTSVCTYVVSQNAAVRIPDLSVGGDPADPEHALTVGSGLRAVLGVPLRDRDDRPVGALAVLDPAPRHWTDADVTRLADVARLLDPGTTAAPPLAALDTAALLDSMREAFLAATADGVVVHLNRAAEQLSGWTGAEVCGRSLQETLLPEVDGRPSSEALRGLIARGSARTRAALRRRDGRRLPVRIAVSTVHSATGPLLCAFLTDVSQQVDAEQYADEQRRFLSALLDSLAVAVAACDSNGRMVLHNRAFRDTHGLPEKTLLRDGDPLPVLTYHPDGTPMGPAERPLMRAARGEPVSDVDVVIRMSGHRSRTFRANSRPITGSDGQRLGAVLAAQDVTAVRRVEAFRACEQKVMYALNTSTIGEAAPDILKAVATTLGWAHAELWLLDGVSDTLHAAGHWSAPGVDLVAQLEEPTLLGQGITGTVWATGRPLWVPDLTDTAHLRTEQSHVTARAYAAQGLHAMLAVPVHTGAVDGTGNTVIGVLACFAGTAEADEDLLTVLLSGVAAQVGRYLAVRRARELADQLARSQEDFITLVGHEMRTPLTSISAYTGLLSEDDTISADARQLVRVIDRNAAALCGIVDDLLDLAGLESGGLPLARHDTDLTGVVDDAVRAAADAAARNDVTVHTHLPAHLMMHGDPRRLRQLVDHLLGNAITYSPDGGDVDVHLRASHTVVELTVTDHGIGIPVADRGRLFDRFHRAGNVAHHGIPGTGLGLATVRAIATLHGGTVTLDVRDGTTMLVRLPLVADG